MAKNRKHLAEARTKRLVYGDEEFEIQKVSRMMLLARSQHPIVANLARNGQVQAASGSVELGVLVRELLTLSLTSPKIVPDQTTPDYENDQAHFDDLVDYHDRLFDEVLVFSGWEKGTAEALRFRDREPDGEAAGAARTDGGAEPAGSLAGAGGEGSA